MRRSMLLVLNVLSLMLGACGSAATPTPMPTATATFEQSRAQLVAYLRAFNKIDNDLERVLQGIKLPGPGQQGTPAELSQFGEALTALAAARQDALRRLEGLPAPASYDAWRHLEDYRDLLREQSAAVQQTTDALKANDVVPFLRGLAAMGDLNEKAAEVNRATESLMLIYNVTDAEVDYRFRGK